MQSVGADQRGGVLVVPSIDVMDIGRLAWLKRLCHAG
jgi:hypothetical protein